MMGLAENASLTGKATVKLRIGWFSAGTAVVTALSALAGFAEATPASAASWTHLCVVNSGNTQCMNSEGLGDAASMEPRSGSTTNWTYPTTNSSIGEIKQANDNLCLQVDASAGGIVRGAKCINDSAEQWVNFYNTYTKRTVFFSEYYLGQKEDRCLNGSGPLVDATDCTTENFDNWYFQWGT
jgi:hypothetical protein